MPSSRNVIKSKPVTQCIAKILQACGSPDMQEIRYYSHNMKSVKVKESWNHEPIGNSNAMRV